MLDGINRMQNKNQAESFVASRPHIISDPRHNRRRKCACFKIQNISSILSKNAANLLSAAATSWRSNPSEPISKFLKYPDRFIDFELLTNHSTTLTGALEIKKSSRPLQKLRLILHEVCTRTWPHRIRDDRRSPWPSCRIHSRSIFSHYGR